MHLQQHEKLILQPFLGLRIYHSYQRN